jgi:hypothetical protein
LVLEKKENKRKFVLRIDANTMEALEKWATDEFRSVNGQLEFILTKALKEARRLRDKVPGDLPAKSD